MSSDRYTIAERLTQNFTDEDCKIIEGMCHDTISRMFTCDNELVDWWQIESAASTAIKSRILAAIVQDAKEVE